VLISLQLESFDIQYLIKEIEDLSLCNNGDDNDDYENNDIMVKNGDRIFTFNDNTITFPPNDTMSTLISSTCTTSTIDNNPINMLIKKGNMAKIQVSVAHNNDNKYHDSSDLMIIKESDIANNHISPVHNNVEDLDAEIFSLNEQQEEIIDNSPVVIVDEKIKASLCNSVSDNYVENSDRENFLFNDKQKQGGTQTSSSEMFNDNSIEIIDRKRCGNIQTGAMRK
jgi:hypothetical protein